MNLQKVRNNQSVFEQAKKNYSDGKEYWSARELAKILGYQEYRNFLPVILKAKEACFHSNQEPKDHFVDIHEMVPIGSGASREMLTTALSRYACYLIVQNADPTKPIVALGQTYFAVQTRKQELLEQSDYQNLKTEDERRLFLRNQLRVHNRQLAGVAKNAGVLTPIDYAIFQDHGYKGLYGGLASKEIHARKSLKKGQQILDHMGSTELAANLFRATQTEEKLQRDKVNERVKANQTHYEVGRRVRKTIEEIGGTMPENLPGVASIRVIERKEQKISKSINRKDKK